MAKIKLIVGLGNPGKEYEGTRHNVGFDVIDKLAGSFGEKVSQKKFNALIGEVMMGDVKLLFVKPQQYMNRSGLAVATAAGFYKIDRSDIIVVSDDLALDPGVIRIRAKGSSGGQKGLNDIIQKLGSDEVARLRVGIGKDARQDTSSYVLGRPGKEDRELIEDAVAKACKAILCWVDNGVDETMTRFNARD